MRLDGRPAGSWAADARRGLRLEPGGQFVSPLANGFVIQAGNLGHQSNPSMPQSLRVQRGYPATLSFIQVRK